MERVYNQPNPLTVLAVGENFLRYKVLALIGGGGMGDVYLAKDQQLERKVAIKVLKKRFSHPIDDGLERFMLEARSASALNHPNIITIYEIGEFGGGHYIASEYVEGQTLHERLGGRSIGLDEILNITIQIAEALTAAHTAGIVHRDIKPENVMIREDGYVKVLDFGLAKLTERGRHSTDIDDDTKKMMATDPGTILGTVSYMSPEQARARAVDGRSDIWSLGVVIYEMVTGRCPFSGETTSDVIAAILRSDPPEISVHSPNSPADLVRIISKALRKDREERYQHIKDLLIDLKDLRRELEAQLRTDSGRVHATDEAAGKQSSSDADAHATTVRFRATTRSIRESLVRQFRLHPLLAILAGVAVLLAIIGGGYMARNRFGRRVPPDAFQAMRFTRLTSTGNAVGGLVAMSRDGKYVAYAVDEGGKESLWVRQTMTAGTVQIVPAGEYRFTGLAFTNDGNHIYFTATAAQGDGPGIYTVGTLGGTSRKVVENAYGPVSFSPDGRSVAFVRSHRELMTADAAGGNERVLAAAGAGQTFARTAWSPDGERIATRIASDKDGTVRIAVVSVAGGTVTPIGKHNWLSVSGIAWLPEGNGLLLTARDNDIQYSQVWQVALADNSVTRITNDLANYIGLSVKDDGKTLVTIKENRVSNIWVADAPNADARQVTTSLDRDEGMSGISIAPDGKVVYSTRIVGSQDLWLVDPNGGDSRQLTLNSASNFWPAVSPDGRSIAFISNRSGNTNLWKMGMDGGNPVQLTDTPGIEGLPSFTPDGRWLIYQYVDENRETSIWKIRSDGGEGSRLVGPEASRPLVAPDGRTFACRVSIPGGEKRIALIPIDGGDPSRLLDLPQVVASPVFHWSSDGGSFIYLDARDAFTIMSQPVDGGPARTLTKPNGERIFYFDVSRNGNLFVFARGTETSDAVLLSDFR